MNEKMFMEKLRSRRFGTDEPPPLAAVPVPIPSHQCPKYWSGRGGHSGTGNGGGAGDALM
jgi:hypothetical protein